MKALITVFFMIPLMGIAQCLEGDCQNGFGVTTNDTGTYYGGFEDGEFNGLGILVTADGETAIYGEFVAGTLTGLGIIIDDVKLTTALYFNTSPLSDRYFIAPTEGGVHFPVNSDDDLAQEDYLEADASRDCFIGDCSNGWGAQQFDNGIFISKNEGGEATTGPILAYNKESDNIIFALGPDTDVWATLTFEGGSDAFIIEDTNEDKGIVTQFAVNDEKMVYLVEQNGKTIEEGSFTDNGIAMAYNPLKEYFEMFKKMISDQGISGIPVNSGRSTSITKKSSGGVKPATPVSPIGNSANSLDDEIAEARAMLEEADYEGAMSKINGILRKYGDVAEAYAYRGLLNMVMQGDVDAGIDDVTKALEVDPNDGFSNYAAGLIFKSGDTQEAKEWACEYFQKAYDNGYSDAASELENCN
ncbi:hypothetical protein [Gilvibacter sp.]|uniref:hypothetical protein n=1 Tax=Gilvibacter sp. TaxID=2729997 RepID=UPI0025C35154|nr:hypothetical protein [Gilvibacter sp.]NQX77661.1 hypothetical protein [Gilvibacter sp.]